MCNVPARSKVQALYSLRLYGLKDNTPTLLSSSSELKRAYDSDHDQPCASRLNFNLLALAHPT